MWETLMSLHRTGRASGQNVVEYGLLMASIVVVVLIGVTAFGNLIQPWFISLTGRITTIGT
jgi:Flp pilus assembly pilin Flp